MEKIKCMHIKIVREGEGGKLEVKNVKPGD